MDEVFIQNVLSYAAQHQMELAERLGYGVHGIIFATVNKPEGGSTAVKVHREAEAYIRERLVYERLKEAGIARIQGFSVPHFIRANDELRIIEMTIVKRPFVLDFAGAYLDAPPEFSEEIWAEWETGKQEQFDERWPKVKAVLAALEELDVYMVDVSPSNIAF